MRRGCRSVNARTQCCVRNVFTSGRLGCLAGLAAIVIFFLMTAGPPAPLPTPRGSFAFAALGDAPYYPWEEWRFRTVLKDLDQHDLSAVIHVGDVFWRPCTDDHYRMVLARFERLRHPVAYTPGDNEWTDCWENGSGAFDPLERLASLRRIFFARPPALPAYERQPVHVENARWRQHGIVFATLHLPGSRNGTGKTPEGDAAARERLEAGVAWLRATFARAQNAPAVVLAFHTGLYLDRPRGHDGRAPYEPFIAALEEEVARYRKPVLIIHGDDHNYTVEKPLRHLPNLTRLEVPGSPAVGWVRVVVTPRAVSPWAFTPRIAPKWKFW